MSSPTTYKSRKRILLDGFIREIKSILTKDTIIPNEIIILCSLFLSFAQKIFIHVDNRESLSLHVLDLELKTISKLIPNNPSNLFLEFPNPHCYIPNISQYLKKSSANNSNLPKSFDGIITSDSYSVNSDSQGINILTFESDHADNDTIKYYKDSSQSKCDLFEQLIFCGKDHGIIYELNGCLYQCKLQQIDLRAVDINFSKISDDAAWENENYSGKRSSRTQLKYLPNDKIFAIWRPSLLWGVNYGFGEFGPLKTNELEDLSLICAIFDFKTKKWNKITDFICKRDKKFKGVFSKWRGICYDEYRENIVYVVGSKGDVSQYDMVNDEWKYWDMERKLNLGWTVECWMDNKYIICCSDGKWFGNIDIREQDSNPQWNVMEDTAELTSPIVSNLPSWKYRPLL